MHLTIAYTRVALVAAGIPPAAYESSAELALIATRVVACTDEVRISVVLGTTRAATLRSDEITEACPCDANLIGGVRDIEVTVNTVLYIAVVNPKICSAFNMQRVSSVTVVCASSLQRKVADYDVLVLYIEYTSVAGCTVLQVLNCCTRETVDSCIATNGNRSVNIDCTVDVQRVATSLCILVEVRLVGNENRVLVTTSCRLITPTKRLIGIVCAQTGYTGIATLVTASISAGIAVSITTFVIIAGIATLVTALVATPAAVALEMIAYRFSPDFAL